VNSRSLAAKALRQVTAEGASLTAALDSVLPSIPQANDRAFVQALCFGVTRWYFRLDFILRQLATKPIRDEEIRLLALLGLYQLEYSRVKPHAAVAETVEAAGGKTWAKPLLNGVLRNFQRERERLLALADSHETAAFSHPAWLIGKIRKSWPEDCAAILDRANLPPPMSLRVNLSQGGREAYLETLKAAEIPASPCRHANSGIILDNPVGVEHLPGFGQGRVSVQDESAQLAADLLDLQAGQRVLDVCAAPGGKTLHILESQPNLAEVVALDIAPDRLGRITENLARVGFTATVKAGDAANPSAWWDGKPFDRILLDAPCSATGVIRRHPDIKLLRQAEDILQLAVQQRRILENIWPLLAKDGLLVYATCSILKEENEKLVAGFLHAHPEAKEITIKAEWGRACSVGRQILSGENGMDGFYYALLSK